MEIQVKAHDCGRGIRGDWQLCKTDGMQRKAVAVHIVPFRSARSTIARFAQLPVTSDTSAAIVGFYLNFHTLEKATLIGMFKR